jgi:hypothetical protein
MTRLDMMEFHCSPAQFVHRNDPTADVEQAIGPCHMYLLLTIFGDISEISFWGTVRTTAGPVTVLHKSCEILDP